MARNFDEIRPVTIGFGASAAFSPDAYAAVVKRVYEIEAKYNENPASVADVTAQKTVLTGNTPYKIFVFDLTTVMATGTYTFLFVEEAPNQEIAASV